MAGIAERDGRIGWLLPVVVRVTQKVWPHPVAGGCVFSHILRPSGSDYRLPIKVLSVIL